MAGLSPDVAGIMASIGSALAAASLLTAAADEFDRRPAQGPAIAAVAVSALLFLAGLPPLAVLGHVAIALGGLGLGLWAAARGLASRSDAHLFAATLLWAGPDLLRLHLAGAALVAVAIGVALLGRQAVLARSGAGAEHQPAAATMPLAAAIACGGLLVVLARAGLLGTGG